MARSNTRWTAATRAAIGLLLVVTAALTGPAPMAAAAAPAPPGGLTSSLPDASTPILSWGPVTGAVRYEVQVDDDPAFGSPYGRTATVSTVNTSYVPTSVINSGANHWQVRAVNAQGERSEWSQASFTTPAVSVPQLLSPIGGRNLQQPNDPPLLTWKPVPGADSYQVLVDGDSDLVGAQTYTTKHTSLVVPDLLGQGDWFWQVTAIKGPYSSRPSTTGSFNVLSVPTPTLRSPINGTNVQDVVLDWDPVPGAKSYDVQVSTNRDFTVGDARILDVSGVLGTRYSPATTFDNASYFWRVRAVDVEGNAPDWRNGTHGAFTRSYPQKPVLVHPANGATVGDPMYFQWEPVKHASEYELSLSTDAGFSPANTTNCRVAGTNYTPGLFSLNVPQALFSFRRKEETCRLDQAGATYWWKVRPLDRPFTKQGAVPGVQGLYSDTRSFVYDPVILRNMAPTGGQTVDVPTLSWQTAASVSHYAVDVWDKDGSRVASTAGTRSTSWTPPGQEGLDPADGPFTWAVRAYTTSGGQSLQYSGHSFNLSGSIPAGSASPLTPAPVPNGTAAPKLTWAPHPDAAYYVVDVGQNGFWFASENGGLIGKPVPYPTMTDTSARLREPGTYAWRVRAYRADGSAIGTGPQGTFTINPLSKVTGHLAAIGGQGFAGGRACTSAQSGCVLPTTPVLKWDADPTAAFYLVYVSRDPNFTNLLEADTSMQATTNTFYYPTLSNREWTFADRTAGSDSLGDSYYWHVRPCRSAQYCGAPPVSSSNMAEHTFKKESPRPQGLSSSNPAGTEITFTWHDYLPTNQAYVWAQTGERANQSAMQYRIQVDDDPSFGSPIDTRVVDQPTHTAPTALYPEGTYFWRVQAVDSASNGLAWSEVKSFTKASPRVSVISPTGNQTIADSTAFRWQAQTFASSYDVELYRNDDRTFSVANRVFAKQGLKTTAYAHNAPLEPNAKPYVWRVRRTDAKGNKGPWTAAIPFTVAASAPTITAPANGGSQPATAPMVSWRPVAGATSYEVTIRPSSGSGTTEVATTPASAYAATKRFPTGAYTAIVRARNAAGAVVGSSSVAFSVDSGLRATTPVQIQATAGTHVGQPVTISQQPIWNQPGVTNAYQWLRGGTAIRGATGTTYVLTADDIGKALQLRVTGTKPNFDTGTTVSNSIGASLGDAVTPITLPTVTGTTRVGQTLRVLPGSWSQPGARETGYQWLRNGRPIAGATRNYYRLVTADAGRRIRVQVTAEANGFAPGTAQTPIRRVAKLRSATAIRLAQTRIKPRARARMTITVTVPGVSKPVGKIRIIRGKRVIRTISLRARAGGKVIVRLPRIPRGAHRMRARFLGNATTTPSTSKAIRLTVLRK